LPSNTRELYGNVIEYEQHNRTGGYLSGRRRARTGRVDWAKVDATPDEDIARQIAEDRDTALELTEEALDRALIVSPDETRTPYRGREPRKRKVSA
jgi:hypothetical protein